MLLKFGIQPFWFWNGKMCDDEIVRQIQEMARQGIKGFFIHPRQGLTVPYLSLEWFRKVGIAVEIAKKFELEVWLYDEYPYPSGAGGGVVISDHPEFEAKSLKRETMEASGHQTIELDLPWGQVLVAKAFSIENEQIDWENPLELISYIGTGYKENIFQMSGLTQYNRKRYFTGTPINKFYWTAPEGKWHIEFVVQTTVENFKYFGKYIDPLNPDAITYYIKTTHEKYREQLGHEFGKTIKGIFTDEISPFPNDMPWSPSLSEEFRKRNRYSLTDRLLSLFEPVSVDTNKVRYDYWNTVTELFIQSYEIPIHNWCQKNNLLYAGEKPIVRSTQLKNMDIPGIDAGHQKAGSIPKIVDSNYRANGKIVTSAAHFYNKSGTLCECFHSIGWGMTLQDMKWICDSLFIQGIIWLVPHAFFYTTDGLTKHDAPPSSFYQAPFWRHMSLLTEYVARVTEVINGSKRKVNILLLDPITSLWTSMGEKMEVCRRLKEDFSYLQKILLRNHLDYYVIDPTLLEQCEIIDKCIKINEEMFELLILPPMLNIEDKAFEKITEYIEKDGKIIGSLCLPVEQIGSISGLEQTFSRWFDINAGKSYHQYLKSVKSSVNASMPQSKVTNRFFADNLEVVPQAVEKFILRDVSVEIKGERGQCGDILTALFEKENKTFCLLTNLTGNEHRVMVALRVNSRHIQRLTCISLGLECNESIDYKEAGENVVFPLEFCWYQSHLIAVEYGLNAELEKPLRVTVRKVIDIKDNWNLSVYRLNAIRLDTWYLQLAGNEEEYLVKCQPIINQIFEAHVPLTIKLKEHFGCPKVIELPSLECRYRAAFELDADVGTIPIYLVIEPGSIDGIWRIVINGQYIDPEEFQNREIFLPTNLAAEISSVLKAGLNEIYVLLKTNQKHDGLLNPMYICGDFSVFKDELSGLWRIASFKNIGEIGDVTGNGLPFYAGEIRYKKMIILDIDSIDDDLELFINDPSFQDAVELYMNGQYAGGRAWSPYSWRIEKSFLKPLINELELHVSTTLIGLFEGQYFDHQKHRYIDL